MDKITLLKMQTAFCNVFKCRKEVCENIKIQKWMEDAPLELVDYEGTLDGETPKLRDMRKERFEVYDKDIKPLAECLKEIKPEYKPLTMWEVIFTAYNEILNVDTIIYEAEHQLRDSSQSVVGARLNRVLSNQLMRNSQQGIMKKVLNILYLINHQIVIPRSYPMCLRAPRVELVV